MKKIILLIYLFLLARQIHGQDSLSSPLVSKNQFHIHYYPSTLLVGDISFGLEHVYKKRFGQEFSLNVKTFQTNFYYYNKGYRIDYLIKYTLFNGKKFRFSTNISFEYKDIYFKNKVIDYFYLKETSNEPSELYQTLLEDRRHLEYGLGLGISINYKIFGKLFIGSDLCLNIAKYKVTYNYKEIIYRDFYNSTPYDTPVPSTNVKENSKPYLSPLLRLKFSYLIGKA